MPIQTNLSQSPYFDTFNEANNYHMVLFKPSVAVQTRELNELQSILQNQIERFGDNILQKGTIVSGCNFQYFNNYPYVKLNDTQLDGTTAQVANYVNLYAKSASSNLVSYILAANSGYISQTPNLNTIFVRYVNSGNSGTQTAYNPGDTITIFDANNSIWQVNVPVGGTGSGFANTDSFVFMPALIVSNNSANAATIAASLSVGNTVSDPVSGARAVITEINTTAIANTLVLKVRPYANDMVNTSLTMANNWTFNTGNSAVIGNGSVTISHVTISGIIGSGAVGSPITDGTGKILAGVMTTQGNGYYVAPYCTIKTSNASASIASIIADPQSNLTAQNYKCQVTVANTTAAGNSTPTGMGYAFAVSEGVIYQKGNFIYVAPQSTVVSKYSNTPDQLSVGFSTSEALINSNIDQSLLDNASGTPNYQAPGADRLQLTPTLTVIPTSNAVANTTFFPITAFSLGMPYLQNQQTEYSTLGDVLATRTSETSGNFVTSPFLLSSAVANLDSSSNATTQSNTFYVAISPGEAFISGYRVKTFTNVYLQIKQGIDTQTSNGVTINTNYGSYLQLQEIGGVFNYTLGDYVLLYDTAKQFLSNSSNWTVANTSPSGNAIGTARIRSFVPVTGSPGTPSGQSRLYVYDINMYPGKNIANAKSVYYSNTVSGIADIVLTYLPASNSNIATVANVSSSAMIFPHGVTSTKSTSNVSFTYKGLFNGGSNVTINAAAGTLSLQLGSAIFPYGNGATLTDSQLAQLGLVFHASNAVANSNTAGVSFVTSTSSNVATINAGSTSTIQAGDYYKMFTNTAGELRRVVAVINATAIQLDANASNANNAANIVMHYPQNVPVPLNGRVLKDRNANVSANGSLLTINIGKVLAAVSNATIMTPVIAQNQTVTNKTAKRDTTVILNLSNSAANTVGPWCVGQPDVFRLKKVYLDVNTNIIGVTANVANLASIPSTWTDVTQNFYLDHRQNPDVYDLGYLALRPASGLTLTTGQALVVQFDHYQSSGSAGIFTRASYPVNDLQSYSNVSATPSANVNTQEIPEMYNSQGNYYDLIDTVDFRPRVSNTAANTSGNTALSTVNPIDYGTFTPIITTGTTVSGNLTITGLGSNTSNSMLGVSVFSNNGSVPFGATVTAIVNSTAVNISSTATASGTANLQFVGDTSKYASLTATTFPIDGQQYSSTITQYLGRVDRIVINKQGQILDIPGIPGVDNLSAPPEPADSMTINLLFIPPYPSVPAVLDSNYVNVIDNGIGSQVFTVQRATDHAIAVPVIAASQSAIYQPSGYSMSDIAVLERRISALEYYNSLSQLEQGINNLAIPSSLNGAINRFKYGFFADNFTTTQYSDLQNPEYKASIINNEVVPRQLLNNLEFTYNTANATTNNAISGQFLGLPYAQTVLISQLTATNSSSANTGSVTPVMYNGILTSNPSTFSLITKVDPGSPTVANLSGLNISGIMLSDLPSV